MNKVEPKIEAVAVAMRGRYNENGQVEQNIEVSDRDYANAITTVQKDSMIAEPQIQKLCQINSSQDGVVVSVEGIAPTHTAGHGNAPKIVDSLRIRKLTPKECFRLQGFDDDSFHKAEAVNSNTQLYKQAGNSICVPVVEYIIKALIDAGIFGGEPKPYQFAEGQISFTDCASFDRYIETYMRGE